MSEAKDPATRPDIDVLATLSVIECWLELGFVNHMHFKDLEVTS